MSTGHTAAEHTFLFQKTATVFRYLLAPPYHFPICAPGSSAPSGRRSCVAPVNTQLTNNLRFPLLPTLHLAPCPSQQHLSLLGILSSWGPGLLSPSSLTLPRTRAAHCLETTSPQLVFPFHPESPSSFVPPASSITKTLHPSWTTLLTPPGNTPPALSQAPPSYP